MNFRIHPLGLYFKRNYWDYYCIFKENTEHYWTVTFRLCSDWKFIIVLSINATFRKKSKLKWVPFKGLRGLWSLKNKLFKKWKKKNKCTLADSHIYSKSEMFEISTLKIWDRLKQFTKIKDCSSCDFEKNLTKL